MTARSRGLWALLFLCLPMFCAAAPASSRTPAAESAADRRISDALSQGQALLKEGRLMEARAKFQYVLKQRPDDKTAKGALSKIDRKFEKTAKALVSAARKLVRQGDKAAAKAVYSLPAHPSAPDLLVEKITALLPAETQDADWEALDFLLSGPSLAVSEDAPARQKAQKRLREAVQRRKSRGDYQRGMSFYRRGDWERAKKEFEGVLAAKPGDPDASAMFQKAKAEMLKERGDRIDALYRDAATLYSKEDYTQAADLLKQILVLDPDHLDAKRYLEKIKSLQKSGEGN